MFNSLRRLVKNNSPRRHGGHGALICLKPRSDLSAKLGLILIRMAIPRCPCISKLLVRALNASARSAMAAPDAMPADAARSVRCGRSRMRRKFPVLHRPSGLTRTQILFLLWFERTPRVFLHRRLFLLERYFWRRRWILAHQRWPICGRWSSGPRVSFPGGVGGGSSGGVAAFIAPAVRRARAGCGMWCRLAALSSPVSVAGREFPLLFCSVARSRFPGGLGGRPRCHGLRWRPAVQGGQPVCAEPRADVDE